MVAATAAASRSVAKSRRSGPTFKSLLLSMMRIAFIGFPEGDQDKSLSAALFLALREDFSP
jgi:hypothetical protein